MTDRSKNCSVKKKINIWKKSCRQDEPTAVEAAIRSALEKAKPTDVILLGMWQKYKDQVAENVGYARRALDLA